MSLLWDADYNLICRCFHRRVGTIRVHRYCSLPSTAGREHKQPVIAFGTTAGIGPPPAHPASRTDLGAGRRVRLDACDLPIELGPRL